MNTRSPAASGEAIRVGIVGCGVAGTTLHAPALASLPAFRLDAVADLDDAATRRAAAGNGAVRRTSSWRELVDDPSIDAIAVCVPPRLHAAVALAAIDAGKHVYVEKPLASTLAECDALVERAAAARVVAMVGFNTRWHPQARRARDAIRAGELGAIELVHSRQTSHARAVPPWQRSRTTGGGVISELAVHHVDLWHFLTGSEVREVSAYTRSVGRDDETAVLSARFGDGTVATASFSQGTSRSNDVVVCGAAGSIALSLYRFDGYARTVAGQLEGASGSRLAALRSAIAGLPRALRDHRAGGTWRSTYRDAWRHFGAAIRDGVPIESTLQDGRRASAVVLAAMASAATGRSVEVLS